MRSDELVQNDKCKNKTSKAESPIQTPSQHQTFSPLPTLNDRIRRKDFKIEEIDFHGDQDIPLLIGGGSLPLA